jgi:enoyl-[acyl-carrier-protein] reductase (NADH)
MLSHVKEKAPLAWPGDASALAGTGLYLASDASKFMTGQVLYVDGGYRLWECKFVSQPSQAPRLRVALFLR